MSLDHTTAIVKHQKSGRDAFLGGRLILAQPARGFRAGLDSVLLGAAAGDRAGPLLDLGAGIGTAALVALTHAPQRQASLVELDAATAALARTNAVENGFGDRVSVLECDLTMPGAARKAAGLATDRFDTVIANPPFFASGRGTRPDNDGRAAARHMAAAELESWVRTAAASAAPGGEIIFIYPAEGLAPLLAVFAPRFGALTILPLSPRPGAPASRLLLRGIKGSRAPLSLLPARTIHLADGAAFAPDIEQVLRGDARLDW